MDKKEGWRDWVSGCIVGLYMLYFFILSGLYPDKTHLRIFIDSLWLFLPVIFIAISLQIKGGV